MAPFSDMPRLDRMERAWRIALAAAWPVGMACALFVVNRNIPCCGFSALSGMPCPFCGGTRACAALATLDVASAWHHAPGAVIALGLAAGHTAFLVVEAIVGHALGWRRLWIIGWQAVGCVVAAAWGIRLAIG